MMYLDDPIIEEIRRLREQHAAQFNFDLRAIVAEYQRLEAESERPHVNLILRRTEEAETAPATVGK